MYLLILNEKYSEAVFVNNKIFDISLKKESDISEQLKIVLKSNKKRKNDSKLIDHAEKFYRLLKL